MDRERDAEIARSIFREDEYRRSLAKRDSSCKSRRTREKEERVFDSGKYDYLLKR